jgi:DegV family protein with EDD domain
MAEATCALVADSSISLPASLTQDLPLHVVAFEIHHEGRVYLDGVDITSGDFYDLLRDRDTLPTTSAPQPGAFFEAFQEAAKENGSVLCVTLAASLSAAHQSALVAQEQARLELPGLNVQVVDSRTAGTAEGLLVLEAARLASGGAPLAQLVHTVEKRIPNVQLLGFMETLYYVWRGGRAPRVAMWMGNLLKVKPILELSAGHIGMVERPRTRQRAMAQLLALVKQRLQNKPARVAVIHAGAPEAAQELMERVAQELKPVELFTSELTPVIGVHVGPGLVGCAFHPEEP